jgi:DNA-binding protein HU-beta
MNKQELIAAVSWDTGLTSRDAAAAVSAVFHRIVTQMSVGDGVRLAGFGSFTMKHRRTAMRRNPRTGEPVEVPAHTAIVFKPAGAFKDQINGR